MNWKQGFHALYFCDQGAVYEQINPISAVEQHLFVANRQQCFHLEWNSAVRQFVRQALSICRFEQSWPEISMHFDRTSNYVPRQFIEFHLRVLRDLRGASCA